LALTAVKNSRVRAQKVIDFIECLLVPSGEGQGKPFKLKPWQKKFIFDVYAPQRNGKRVVRRAIFSVARKNGKTALIGALVLAHLIGPEAIENGEIYSAANDREQAAIVFKFAAQLVRADPELMQLLKIVDSTKTITCYGNGSFYRAISAEAGTKHGLNPTVAIYDELAQAKDRELFDTLDTAMGAREEPLFITISTQSKDPQHILSEMIDDGLNADDPSTVCHLYAVPDEEEDIFNPKVWKLANPALGDFRSLEDFEAKARQAQRMPSFENSFRNLYLNQRVDVTTPLISRAEWVRCKDPDSQLIDGEDIYLGLDLSAKTDLTALVAVSANDGDRLASWFWKPKDLLEEHEKRDRVPYDRWVKEGFIYAVPGKTIDYEYVAMKLMALSEQYNIVGTAYDRWRIGFLIKELDKLDIESFADDDDGEGLRLMSWGQGFKDMAPAIDALEDSILNGNLKHSGHPVLTWCFSNATAITDPSGNRKMDKQKARFRIDGAVAAAMAIGLKGRKVKVKEPVTQGFVEL